MQSLSLDVLLEPISAESPAGASLRHDAVYDRIQVARREEPALSQGVWSRPLHQADWPLVEELCCSALTTRSKDLQLAVWLTEAWLRLYGLPGFASGLRLITDLHTHYLLLMLPAPVLDLDAAGEASLPLDADDPAIERRLNLLQWLNEKLAIQLRLLPLSSPQAGEGPPVSLADMEAAQYRIKALRTSGTPAASGPADGGLAASLALTAPDAIAQTARDIDFAMAAVNDLGEMLDGSYGSANGGVLQLQESLEAMGRVILHAVPTECKLPAAPLSQTHAPALELTGEAPAEPSSAVPRLERVQVDGRSRAYGLLGEIADYLAELEPHSPVPYLLRRAIAWGGMSLPELLPELLQEHAALKDVEQMLKIERK